MKIGSDFKQDHPLMKRLFAELEAGTVRIDDTYGVKHRDSCGGETTYILSDGTVIDAISSPEDDGGFFTEYFSA